MHPLIELQSSGPKGPVYLRFSREPVVDSDVSDLNENVAVDLDANGDVVGIELIVVVPETILVLAELARHRDLDLAPMFLHSLSLQPTAAA